MQALEIASFRLKDADKAAFLEANDAVNAWMRRQPGFVQRQLGLEPDGTWIDVITWASRAEALAAAEQMERDAASLPAMLMIDPASVVMRHADIEAVFS